MSKQVTRNEPNGQLQKQTELKTLPLRTGLQAGVQPECDNCYNFCRDKGYSHRDCRYKVCPEYCSSSEHP